MIASAFTIITRGDQIPLKSHNEPFPDMAQQSVPGSRSPNAMPHSRFLGVQLLVLKSMTDIGARDKLTIACA